MWIASRFAPMAYRRTERVLQHLAARHDAIVAAARTIASEEGLAAVQIVPVAQRAGIAAGTVYRYFQAKTDLAGCEVVIRSPGVSRYRPEVERLRAEGVELTTGTNLWFEEHGGERVVAVTGTKGKSTTSSLVAHLLN